MIIVRVILKGRPSIRSLSINGGSGASIYTLGR